MILYFECEQTFLFVNRIFSQAGTLLDGACTTTCAVKSWPSPESPNVTERDGSNDDVTLNFCDDGNEGVI